MLQHEETGQETLQKLKNEIGDLAGFKELTEPEWINLAKFFIEKNAKSVLNAPHILHTFVVFAKKQKFPFTEPSAEELKFETPRFSTQSLLNILVSAGILDYQILPGSQAKAAAHTDKEELEIMTDPRKKIKVYDLDDGFVRRFGDILQKVGIAEAVNVRYSAGKGGAMDLKTEDLLNKAKAINQLVEAEAAQPGSAPGEAPTETEHEKKFFRHITDDLLEPVVDNLLLTLSELEAAGKIPDIDDPELARDAILALVRKLYSKRGLIARMSRKYIRYGTPRALRKAKRDIQKALR